MHELSIVDELLRQIDAVAIASGATAVRRVFVQIGPLSGVDPGLLTSAFAAARGSGFAAEAELVCESSAVRVSCRECGVESAAAPNRLLCGCCGGYRTTLLTGDELVLRRVELNAPGSAGAIRH